MKVVDFVKRVNEKNLKITPNEILEGAANLLESVIVIGAEPSGELFFSTNIECKKELIYQLEQLKFDLLAGEFDYDD